MDELVADILPTLRRYGDLFNTEVPIWQTMKDLSSLIQQLIEKTGKPIHTEAFVDPSSKITNSYVGRGVKIYEGCTIRDSIILDDVTVGHASEVARSVILDRCFIPRFNYVGSSFLGEHVQLGGGVMLASRRHDDRPITVHWGQQRIATEQWKFGSIIGNDVTISFCCHLNPGTVIGHSSIIMPMTDVRGYVPPNSLVAVKQQVVVIKRRPFPNVSRMNDSK